MAVMEGDIPRGAKRTGGLTKRPVFGPTPAAIRPRPNPAAGPMPAAAPVDAAAWARYMETSKQRPGENRDAYLTRLGTNPRTNPLNAQVDMYAQGMTRPQVQAGMTDWWRTPGREVMPSQRRGSFAPSEVRNPGQDLASRLMSPDASALSLDDVRTGLGSFTEQGRNQFLASQPAERQAELSKQFGKVDEVVEMLRSAASDPLTPPDEKRRLSAVAAQLVQQLTQERDAAEIELHNAAMTAAYRRGITAWQEGQGNALVTLEGSGATGGFYGDPDFEIGDLTNDDLTSAPNIVLERDQSGRLMIKRVDQAALSLTGELRRNPAMAAQMIVKLAGWGAYGGGTDRYAAQRVQFDGAGNPVAATWNKDDQEALDYFIKEVARVQASGDTTPWNELLDQVAMQNTAIAQSPGYGIAAPEGGGGGGGFGSGVEDTGISVTSPDLLKQTINGIARARLGQVLGDEEINAFVADYNARERQFVDARRLGLDGVQVDPESAAAAWIESRYRDQAAGMAGNNYITQLAEFLMGGGMASGARLTV